MVETNSETDNINIFKEWLVANGAKFPKIEWPSLDTTSGVRGAVATEVIATNEPMIEIPAHMMMSPPVAFASDIGVYLRQNKDILKSDLLLTIFIMSERSKGSESFFHPFLQILPEPGTIASWLDEDLLHLQDDALHVRAKGRIILIESTYNRTVVALSERHPEIFRLDKFTFENFKFCWFTIMARAFGKRLPWTSLVPFADCLNHSNLQTKYDYDENSNGLFRLYPSGNNSYPKGSEVFNSYGRRANDNLLLDYGFSMLSNEWDKYEVLLSLPLGIPNYEKKKDLLISLGYSSSLSLSLTNKDFPISALGFLRIVTLSELELNYLFNSLEQPTLLHDGTVEDIPIFQRLASIKFKEEKKKCFNRILSISNELSAIKLLLEFLREIVRTRETSTEMDEILLHNMKNKKPEKESDSDVRYDINPKDDEHVNYMNLKEKGVEEDDSWKIQCAVIYRLTKKYIIDKNILKVADLETFYNKKLKRHTANDELLGSETESPSDHMSSQSSQNTMQSTSRTMDNLCIDISGLNFSFSQKSLPRPEYSCNIEEGTPEENQVAILDRSILESKEPVKMTGLQREMAIAKFEVELYILEANSNKLAVEIIPQS